MRIVAKTILVNTLKTRDIQAMYRLMCRYYDNMATDEFDADLQNKQWVILLLDKEEIIGFSTQLCFKHQINGREISVLFSGDTIIEKEYWGSMALPLEWGKLALSLSASQPELYWLLTSKGYRTYCFLSVFFRSYYPAYNGPSECLEKELLWSICSSRFVEKFDSTRGILCAPSSAQCLKKGIADINARSIKDPHIAFFHKMNPGHMNGDELVCLARISIDNLTPFIVRRLMRGGLLANESKCLAV